MQTQGLSRVCTPDEDGAADAKGLTRSEGSVPRTVYSHAAGFLPQIHICAPLIRLLEHPHVMAAGFP